MSENMLKEIPTPLPCPFCNAELIEKSDEKGIWTHQSTPYACVISPTRRISKWDIYLWNYRVDVGKSHREHKLCPFCGSKMIEHKKMIVHKNTGCIMSCRSIPDHQYTLWNKRVGDDE